ncbi:MAG: hypothetical protein HRU20_20225 [Pseudomonadales bacterium]|nr:hypothetical protein [Pseudomonadales bacterium]
MSQRSFIFCDICNKQGIRNIEERREINRPGGRRINDERAWFEGSKIEAENVGWKCDDGEQFCPHCAQRLGHYQIMANQCQPSHSPTT